MCGVHELGRLVRGNPAVTYPPPCSSSGSAAPSHWTTRSVDQSEAVFRCDGSPQHGLGSSQCKERRPGVVVLSSSFHPSRVHGSWKEHVFHRLQRSDCSSHPPLLSVSAGGRLAKLYELALLVCHAGSWMKHGRAPTRFMRPRHTIQRCEVETLHPRKRHTAFFLLRKACPARPGLEWSVAYTIQPPFLRCHWKSVNDVTVLASPMEHRTESLPKPATPTSTAHLLHRQGAVGHPKAVQPIQSTPCAVGVVNTHRKLSTR